MSLAGDHRIVDRSFALMGIQWLSGLFAMTGANLRGHPILIVEEEIAPFVQNLQAALEHAGADTLIARSPSDTQARAAQFDFSATAIGYKPDSPDHRLLVRRMIEEA